MGLNGIGGGGGGLLSVTGYAQALESGSAEDVAKFINAVSGASDLRSSVIGDTGEFSTDPFNIMKSDTLTPQSVGEALSTNEITPKRRYEVLSNSNILLDRRKKFFKYLDNPLAMNQIENRFTNTEIQTFSENNSFVSDSEMFGILDSGNPFDNFGIFDKGDQSTSYQQQLVNNNISSWKTALVDYTGFGSDTVTISSNTSDNYIFADTLTVETGNTLTLDSDTTSTGIVLANDITVNGTIDGTDSGVLIYGDNTVTNNGTIKSNMARAGGSSGYLIQPDTFTITKDAGDGGDGGSGGNGGSGVIGGGGGGDDGFPADNGHDFAYESVSESNLFSHLKEYIIKAKLSNTHNVALNHSELKCAGGGDGADDGDGELGGDGGRSAPPIYISTTDIDNSGTISATGGDGDNGEDFVAGGGGGGKGGIVVQIYDTVTSNSPTTNLGGGAGGNGGSDADNGSAGGPGTLINVQY